MHISALSLLTAGLAVLPGVDAASKVADNDNQYCMYTVLTGFKAFTYNTTDATSAPSTTRSARSLSPHSIAKRATASAMPDTMCTYHDEVIGVWASVKTYCNDAELEEGMKMWKKQCKKIKVPLMDLTAIKAEATDEYIASLPWISPLVNKTKKALTEPVILQQDYYKIGYRSWVSNDRSRDFDNYYSWGIMGYWAGILVLGMLHKIYTVSRETIQDRRLHKDVEGGSARQVAPAASLGTAGRYWHKLRTWIVIPAGLAPFTHKHQRLVAGWGTMPRRLDLLIVAGYWIVLVALSLVSYETFDGNLKFPYLTMANLNYVGNRTGYMAEMGLVFVWVFSGRNNVFQWVTNFSFRSFNIFHRQSAIAATVLVVVHTVTYVWFEIEYKKKMATIIHERFIYMGVIAGLAMFLLCLTAHPWVRRKSYELFLLSHIGMSGLTIYAVWDHVEKPNLRTRIWPLVAIWALERFLRLVRLVYCNLHVRFGKHIVRNDTKVQYLAASDLLRIEVTPGADGARFPFPTGPGQYYYLYQPARLTGWESHPFTLGSSGTDAVHGGEHIVFYVRPYDGWTKRLQAQCEKADGGIVHPKMLLEGPYGHAASLHHFDTLLLFVGGTGVSAALPYIQEYLRRKDDNKTRTTKVHLIWSNRTQSMFDHVLTTDLAAALDRPDVQFSCHLTRATPGDLLHRTTTFDEEDSAEEKQAEKQAEAQRSAALLTSSSETEETETEVDKGAGSGSSTSNSIHNGRGSSDEKRAAVDETPKTKSKRPSRPYGFIQGRPDVEAITAEAVEEARAAKTSVAVLVCGPGHMADKARKAVFTAMRSGFYDIEYFEEAFGW